MSGVKTLVGKFKAMNARYVGVKVAVVEKGEAVRKKAKAVMKEVVEK